MTDATALKRGRTVSCGCRLREVWNESATRAVRTHGMTQTPEYRTWTRINSRCFDRGSKDYPNYGGRGIVVCERWRRSFERFFADMGPRPTGTYSIDRIDNDGPYAPGNCRWATPRQQLNNRRTNRRMTAFGRTATASELAELHGIARHVVYSRLDRGWDIEAALTRPLRITRLTPRQAERRRVVLIGHGAARDAQGREDEQGAHGVP